jgi:Tol biopolymer transport system component
MLRWLILIFFLSLRISLFSQNWNAIYSKELEAEDFIYGKQYERAAEKYEDALRMIPSSANLKYKIGKCYLLTPNKKHLAVEFLEGAANGISKEYNPRAIKEESAPPDALYELGRAYQITNQFDKAINAFQKFKDYLQPGDPLIRSVEKRIESARHAPQFMADAIGVKTNNLGNTINNKNQNFNAIISGDGKTLAYTSLGSNGYDIYVSRKKGDNWEKPRRISDDLRANFLTTSSLSYDGNWMYLVDEMSTFKSIFDTFYDEGWVRAKKLKKPITSKFNETHAALTPDGKTMYFVSDRPGGLGGLDIYKTTQDNKGRWGDPENLGPRVNTELNENTPFITPDGKYLFFSSEGHNSMGGYDIFYVDLSGSGNPINLGYPINNGDDNLFFFPESLNQGLMALSEESSLGPQDIYRVNIIPLVNLIANLSINQDISSTISGDAKISIYNAESIDPVAELSTALSTRGFTKKILPGEYRIVVKADGFEDYASQLSINDSHRNYNFDIELIAIPKEPEPMLAVVTDPIVSEVQETIIEPEKIEQQVTSEDRGVEIKKDEEKIEVEVAVKKEEPPVKKKEPVRKEEPRKTEPTPTKPKEEAKQVQRSTFIAEAPTSGQFTVQIMALLVPISENHFQNIDGITVTQGTDGYYRYTVGAASTREEARTMLSELKALGYKDAFIRKHQTPIQTKKEEVKGNFTIQVLALKNPVDASRLGNLSDLSIVEGDDSFFRYFTGNYNTYEQARNDLPKIVGLGYKGAFVRKK